MKNQILYIQYSHENLTFNIPLPFFLPLEAKFSPVKELYNIILHRMTKFKGVKSEFMKLTKTIQDLEKMLELSVENYSITTKPPPRDNSHVGV